MNENSYIIKIFKTTFFGFTQNLLGGHFLETVKIKKQIAENNKTYYQVINNLYKNNGKNILWHGYFPWGALQSTKSIPLILTNNYLKDTEYKKYSGLIGGSIQGIYLTPLQNLKSVMINNKKNEYNNIFNEIKNSAISKTNLLRGLNLMVLRNSINWQLRIFSSYKIDELIKDSNFIINNVNKKLISGFCGGVILGTNIFP